MSGFIETPFALNDKRIFVAGHNGLVGHALLKRLASEHVEVLTASRDTLDLRDQTAVRDWFHANKPDCVILAAARVGGIGDNDDHSADFMTDNLLIQTHVMQAAHVNDVKKLVFLGSSCIYPKHAPQPLREDSLMSGALEPTNAAYAVAKIAGITMVQAMRKQYGRDFITLMPCNLYGPHDRFDLARAHVLPALMMKAHAAKMNKTALQVWGTGTPLREFMHADDAANGIVFALKHYSDARPLNLGSGEEVSIRDLALNIAETVGFDGDIIFDNTKPDGTPRKIMDSSRMREAGWTPRIALNEGLRTTYEWYRNNVAKINKAA